MSLERKIALFIDCENISHNFVEDIFNELPKYGKPVIKQAYANWSKPNSHSWHKILPEYGIKPKQAESNIPSKNASDMEIVIDIMDTMSNGKIEAIILVSSDSDFTSIASNVKAKGFDMIGFGEAKTNISFRNACSTFVELPVKKKIDKCKSHEIIKIVTNAIIKNKGEEDFALLAKIGTYLKNQSADYTPSNYGGGSWKDIIKQYPENFNLLFHPTKKSTLCVSIKG